MQLFNEGEGEKIMAQDDMENKTKNIILCSDDTGNKGGAGVETNVYQLYNSVDIHEPDIKQVVFYENGVDFYYPNHGEVFFHENLLKTQEKLIKSMFSILNKRVIDLYFFLVHQYEPGDTIYMFGFSHGSAAIRGFSGFLQICGLVDKYKKDASGNYERDDRDHKVYKCDEQLILEIRKAFDCYTDNDPDTLTSPESAIAFKKNVALHHEFVPNGNIPIKFIGVWDTVSALGFPEGLNGFYESMTLACKNYYNYFYPHKFYNYQLNDNVEYVYHALALDDEYQNFHPKIWRENVKENEALQRPKNIEQVWFSGVHGNMGGSYSRKGLSNVTFDWMLKRAQYHGLHFISGFCQNIEDSANVHDRLYDSRGRLSFFNRYAPRDIHQLCIESGKIAEGQIKVHESVLSRIKCRASEYTPSEIPWVFKIVSSQIGDKYTGHSSMVDNAPMSKEVYTEHKEAIHSWETMRVSSYHILTRLTMAYILIALWLWQFPVLLDSAMLSNSIVEYFNQIVVYFVPKIFEDFVVYYMLVNQLFGIVSCVVAFALFFYREKIKNNKAKVLCNFRDNLLLDIPNDTHAVKQFSCKRAYVIISTVVANTITIFILLLLIANIILFKTKIPENKCGTSTQYLIHPDSQGLNFSVNSEKFWNASSIFLRKNHLYQISLNSSSGKLCGLNDNTDERDGLWCDEDESLNITGWPVNAPFYIRWAQKYMARNKDQSIFQLMSIIASKCNGNSCIKTQAIELDKPFTATQTGEFCAYANDLPFMYWNNSGTLQMTIREVGR